MSTYLDLSSSFIENNGISISSLLQGRTDISGIFITYTESYDIVVVDNVNNGHKIRIPELTPGVEDASGIYYPYVDTESGFNTYIIQTIEIGGVTKIVIPQTQSFRYKLATPEEEAGGLIIGETYIPAATEIYSVSLSIGTPILYNAPIVQEDISGIPPRLSDYTIGRILKAFDYRESGPMLNNLKVYETITEDIKAQSQTLEDGTTVLPQFKSHNDYLAYKNSLNNRNYVRKNA